MDEQKIIMKTVLKKVTILLIGLAYFINVGATDIFVAPYGNDANDGLNKPLSSLSMAIRKAREIRRNCKTSDSIKIHIRKGTYRLYEPIFLRPEDYNLEIIGDYGTIISGGITVTGWKKNGKLWVTDAPDFNGHPLDFRQMWVNGVKAVRARDVVDFENMHRIKSINKEKRIIWVPKSSIEKVIHSQYTEMVLHEMWCIANLRIKNIVIQGDSAGISFQEPESSIQFEHPWPSPMVTNDGKHNSPFYLTNSMQLLDNEGEWYHDIRSGKLYYYPRDNEDMTNTEVIIPALETLVQITGTPDYVVNNITFRNIQFENTSWIRPSYYGHVPLQAGMYLTEAYKLNPKMVRNDGNHKLDNQGWLGRANAAVEIRNGNDINFRNCTFQHLGGSGIDYIIGDKRGIVDSCIFRDIAMNGYVSGSFSTSGIEAHLPYNPKDKREICEMQTISNSIFKEVANEDWGCVAIAAGFVANINIENNNISEIPYTGISLGWGWTCSPNCMHDNRVYGNTIYHYAMHMYDTAGIYTLGAQPGTVISHNKIYGIYHPSYVHDPEHWFYLYTDEGSSGITVKDNWTESEKFLKNANGPGNIWKNNGRIKQ